MRGGGDRRARFPEEYLVDLNATQAAIRCGYSPKSAYAQGHALLKDPQIAAEIERLKAKRSERVGDLGERVLAELEAIGFADLRDVLDDDGQLRPLPELPERVSKAVESVTEAHGPKGRTRRTVRLHSKLQALGLLMDHLGMRKTKVEHGGKVELEHSAKDPKDMSIAELMTERRRLKDGG